MTTFVESITTALAGKRHLCVGIDPHASLLNDWGLPDSAAGAERMGRSVLEAAAGQAACVKPQVAFFERFGAAGYTALERVLSDARSAGVPVIADVKRGDIGSSFDAYAHAWLSPGSPLEADAMTVVAYQGFRSVQGAFDLAAQHGKGVFVLAATSNPEASDVQQSIRPDGRTVAQAMVEEAMQFNQEHFAEQALGNVGVVLGATLNLADFSITTSGQPSPPFLPVLAPGFGAQGARIENAQEIFGSLAWALLANESRGILAGGESGLGDRIRRRSDEIALALSVS